MTPAAASPGAPASAAPARPRPQGTAAFGPPALAVALGFALHVPLALLVDRVPLAGTIHALASLSPSSPSWSAARIIAGDAWSHGIASHVYLHGESAGVADAIEAHYHPRFASDSLPRDNIGGSVALADKLDTLVGIYGIGFAPTGDKDPFGLRRQALGVLRILSEKALPLDLV